MHAEDFQLIGNSTIDDSNIERDCMKIYHQNSSEVTVENQNNMFYFGKNPTYVQIGYGYIKHDEDKKSRWYKLHYW